MKRSEASRAMEIEYIRRTNGDFAAFVAKNMERFVENIGPVSVRYQLASHDSIDEKLARIPVTSRLRDRISERMYTNSTLIVTGVYFLEAAGRVGAGVIATKLTNSPETGVVVGIISPTAMNLGLHMGSAVRRGVSGLRERVVSRFAKNS